MMSSDAKTLAEYLSRLKQENDIINGQMVKYNEGLMKGEEIGKEIGKEIGRKQNALDTAKNLLVMGLSLERIAQAVGLPLAEIEGLRGF